MIKRLIRRGCNEYEIYELTEEARADDIVDFADRHDALFFLQEVAQEAFGLHNLRSLLAETGCETHTAGQNDTQVIEYIADQLMASRLAVARLPDFFLPSAWMPAPEERDEAEEGEEAVAEEKTWIEIYLLDEADQPVAGERYEVELPDGRVRRGSTNAEGLIRLVGITSGSCQVSFPNLDEEAWEEA